jgi:hypothetical protein
VVAHIVQQIAHFNQHPFGLIRRMALAPQASDEFLLFTDARFLLRDMRPLRWGSMSRVPPHRGNALCDGWLPLGSETKLSALVDSSDQGCGLGLPNVIYSPR